MAHSKLYIRLMNAREWKEVRAAKLQANPLCERCAIQGYVRAANVVHHLVEVESGKTEHECRQLAYSFSNLQSLCRECHAEIHKQMRYNTREAHQKREKERLNQWIKKHGK